jgi:hypothetical protein
LLIANALAGETFRDAAVRGLQEELGISITGAALPQQPLGPMHRRSLVAPGSYLDNELVESYELRDFQGEVRWRKHGLGVSCTSVELLYCTSACCACWRGMSCGTSKEG